MTETPETPDQPDSSDQRETPEQPVWGSAATPPPGIGSDHPAGPAPAGSTVSGPQPGHRADGFFDTIRGWGITRPDSGRVGAGVAAGLARRWNVHPTPVRLGFAILALLGGLGITLYGLGWLFLPHPDGRIHAQQLLTGTLTAGALTATLLTVISGLHLAIPLLPLALIAGLIWLIARRRHHQYRSC